jgi:hypothetical protein
LTGPSGPATRFSDRPRALSRSRAPCGPAEEILTKPTRRSRERRTRRPLTRQAMPWNVCLR